MNETNHEPQQEPTQQPENKLEPDMKAAIKTEIKEELKQEFIQHKKKKFGYFLKFFIVFLFGLGIGLFAGHHEHGHSYRSDGGRHMKMHHEMYKGEQKSHHNRTRGE